MIDVGSVYFVMFFGHGILKWTGNVTSLNVVKITNLDIDLKWVVV